MFNDRKDVSAVQNGLKWRTKMGSEESMKVLILIITMKRLIGCGVHENAEM